ncbi:hypothetical protein LNTAR_21460 [Lentisphaera araneosa HTCC2155]|uniref:F5/8 type C domain-containing protein n=2 Tax=Lentisphaera TaxID=256846 RepID=A6DM26_9BACT|nr:hypothetical protein LNTAR_21460 [Lentisphaera araneosa HTCC2155]
MDQMKIRKFLLLLAFTLLAFSNGNATEIKTENMTMKFASDGKPKSLTHKGKELLNVRDPGKGFEICGFAYNWLAPIKIHLNKLSYDGRNLIAKNNHISITMEVTEKHGGLVFSLKRVQGLSKKNQLWLKFGLNCDASLKAVPLDYVTECDKGKQGIEVSLPWLWERSETVPMGSFALTPSTQSIKLPSKAKWSDLKAKLLKDKWYKKVQKAFTVKLTASNNEGSLQNLLDQDKDNRYTTESNMKPGMWLVIEFSAAYLVNTLILDAGKSAGDYPREYRIFVSEDGKNWGKSIKKGTGQKLTKIEGIDKKAKFVKIEQTGSNNVWWSIHDLKINGISLSKPSMLAAESRPNKVVKAKTDPIRIETSKYSLEISNNGQFTSFKYGGKELINKKKNLPEFQVSGFNHEKRSFEKYRLGNAKYKNGKLLLKNGPFAVLFEVKAEEHYLAFKILKTKGFNSSDLTIFGFFGFLESAINVFPLDYMTDCGKSHTGETNVKWKWKWAKGKDLPRGGFAFIHATTDDEYDEALHHIWVKENQPHPKINGEWTVERSKQWMKEWQEKNMDRSRFILTAHSMDDLFYLADKAEQLDMKEIYLHTDTWRGEYWPIKRGFLTVNPKIFPNGEKDFQRFSGYLKEKNIGLTIHTLSCPIANEDPDYTKPTIDPRLADWVKGTLAKPASATDKTLYFKAPPGSELPTIEKGVFGPESIQPWDNINTFQIADEFVTVGSFSDTDTGVWKLNNCQRGSINTKASAHKAEIKARGLIRSYGMVFIPGNDTDMVEELAKRYAEFCNKNGVTHCEQDAAEVHTAENNWGYHKFTEYVYKNIEHMVTSNSSSGRPMPSQMEYKFRKSRNVVKNRQGSKFGMNLHYIARVSTGPYDNSPTWSGAAASGKRTFSMEKNEPMFGITRDILSSHGLTDTFIEKQNHWKKATKLLSADQSKRIRSKREVLYAQTATHEIFDIDKTELGYAITPKQLMRREGIETPWALGSEFGPVAPRQYLQSGDTLKLNNPYPESEPEVIIRVLSALGDGQTDSPQKRKEINEKANDAIAAYNIGAGLQKKRHPLEGAKHIWVAGGEPKHGNCWMRKKFTLKEQAVSGFLFLHADDSVQVYVNGHQVANVSGWDKGHIVDVQKYLKKGDNVLAAEVSNDHGGGCFTGALTIETSKEAFSFLSDKTWLTSSKSQREWNQIKFDDSKWKCAHSFGTFGKSPWPRVHLKPVSPSYKLQPQAKQIKQVGDYQFTDVDNALRLRYSNQRSKAIKNENFPSWRASGSMRGARGIGLTVEGDGSGAILVVQVSAGGHRDYIVPLDFKGKKDIVIPSGEVSWSDLRWGFRFNTKHMKYGSVSQVSLGLGIIPKETNVDIKVSNLRLLVEQPSELKNPVIKIGKGSLQVKGSIKTDHYLWFKGGSSVGVYDLNWNKIKDLPVVKKTFVTKQGKNSLALNAQKQKNSPWLECQFIVKDKKLLVKEKQEQK